MKFVEKTDKTIAEAISSALRELNTTRDNVEVEVLEEPSKGLFGLFGNKLAKVRVIVKNDPVKKATEFLEKVLDSMKVPAVLETELVNNNLYVEIIGKDVGILIGRRGQTLDSLQYLVSLVVNSGDEDYVRVILDTENYRKKREQTLIKLANKLAYKVKKYKKSITLDPMNPYERRIIHSALQNNPYVGTKSQGEEPNRKVVIFLK
ncbi:RNA-binding cell elongation regulator Jag/EloR [Paramaledivibacter caminithermalis]|jgi:spoIIIJ-associated protein|uniref:RNA-binding protein KhpB n=1 Tax=Paramaledivibacter caminithermalis (strain DSM 15212 / CIP 107654 / DViRD3) TaxID=1121301 RepID=A0A1M6NY17_PARC5|nr:RNA-binding cell elongation regulator Jag/EloR [Paramaledivibacter caminithermalis]SHK00615.1 spoIIIJ-associated protein [Paramaledivibacter caminithermalis DSM 15212]